MAEFVKHTGCDNCGSSDAKAHYDDNSTYCYSCGHYKSGTISPYVAQLTPKEEKRVLLPYDCTKEYGPDAVAWAGKYDISVADLLASRNPIYYSAKRNQLIFSWEVNGETLAWQARNLNPVSKSKRYYTQGDINGILCTYGASYPGADGGMAASRCDLSTCVLVEDCLSAIKCSSHLNGLGFDAMPLLGSGISNIKLSRLRHLYGRLIVFLDPDMWHKAVDIVGRAQMLGFKASAIKADKDPKEFSLDTLKKLLTS